MIYIVRDKTVGIDKRETMRYLGMAGCACDEGAEALFKECAAMALEAQRPAACYAVYDISAAGDILDLGFTTVKSRDLGKNLAGCDRIILFACTVGAGIDRLIQKYSRLSPSRAAMLQAMGSAMAESWCDMLCELFKSEYGANSTRFSCGFGDLPLSMQRDIFAGLDVTKNIGISLSDGFFMTPTKSVTAIVGIKGDGQ